MNLARILPVLLALSCGLPAQAAEPPAVAREEIQHLLAYLERSGCQFYRNGTWHDAAVAKGHLARKYGYLVEKGLVRTAEDFLRLGASESSTSGEAYQVGCKGSKPVPSALWLGEELSRYRELRPLKK